LLPLFGIALWFPFSTADTDGYVNYRSTETLYFNEYWYEYEYIKSGNDITYSVQSSPSLISFAIWDEPFESLPTTTKIGSDSDQFSLVNNYYEYISYFLKPGSSIQYNYNASGQIDFFIASGYAFYEWNQGGSPSFYVFKDNVDQGSGDYSVSEARDYYLVWFNEGVTTVNVNMTIDYSAANVIDLTEADYCEEGVDSISQNTFQVPNDGNWYFFVYFDPLLSPEESTTITFDVSYDTGATSTDRWLSIQPILITIIVVAGIVVVAALIARSGQKKLKSKPSSKAIPAKKPVKATKSAKASASKCIRCGSVVRKDAQFCPNCGGKIEGRSIGTPSKVTPANSKSCSLCGSKLSTSDKFCKWCGTEIKS
jgi:RNA polymerase subunit RPABC4/transcription elongation factor Spt4